MLTLVALLVLGGDEVWSRAVEVGPGQSREFKVTGLTVGTHYVLETRGRCERTEQGRARRWRERLNPGGLEPFGVEFKVTLGRQTFTADQDPHSTVFRADEADPSLRVEDRSSVSPHVKCWLTSVAIRTL